MSKNASNDFISVLAEHVANNKRFVDQVVATVVSRMMASGPAAIAAAPQKRGPGRPRKNPVAAPAPKKASGRRGGRRGDAADRVLAAVRSGASTRSAIIGKSGVTIGGYGYAIKTLKARGLVKVHGTRGQAKVVAS